eukprot:1791222-Rhodomonas_salina.2
MMLPASASILNNAVRIASVRLYLSTTFALSMWGPNAISVSVSHKHAEQLVSCWYPSVVC